MKRPVKRPWELALLAIVFFPVTLGMALGWALGTPLGKLARRRDAVKLSKTQ